MKEYLENVEFEDMGADSIDPQYHKLRDHQ